MLTVAKGEGIDGRSRPTSCRSCLKPGISPNEDPDFRDFRQCLKGDSWQRCRQAEAHPRQSETALLLTQGVSPSFRQFDRQKEREY